MTYGISAKPNRRKCRVSNSHGHVITLSVAIPESGQGSATTRVLAHLSKSNSRLFKDFQGPYEGYIRRTKLKQTGTFISESKQSADLGTRWHKLSTPYTDHECHNAQLHRRTDGRQTVSYPELREVRSAKSRAGTYRP